MAKQNGSPLTQDEFDFALEESREAMKKAQPAASRSKYFNRYTRKTVDMPYVSVIKKEVVKNGTN